MMENIHSEVYALLLDTYIRDGAERNRLFHAIDTSAFSSPSLIEKCWGGTTR
jgi:ribonucleotide reductase beta subunit family protein with ferritin-like domain